MHVEAPECTDNQVIATPAAVQRSVSFGLGRKETAALRRGIGEVDPVANLARALESTKGIDAWFSPHTWRDDQRARASWESCTAVVTDLDFCDDKGKHAPPPPEVREQIERAARAGRLTGNLFYMTPRGARVIFLLKKHLFDVDVYDRAFLGGVVLGILDLERAGLLAHQNERGRRVGGFFPDLAVRDLARFFFTPRATVDGVARDAAVVVLRPESCDAFTLAQCADAFADLSVDGARKKDNAMMPAPIHPSRGASFKDAAARFNADNETDWGAPGGTCPACGHHGCFGRSGPSPARWACFSANHERDSNGCGAPGEGCWTGDVLDMRAHEAQLTPVDLLRRDGYLDNGIHRTLNVPVPGTPDATEATRQKRIPFLDLAAIAANGIPPVPWIVEGWLARRDIVLLAGRAGAGKSTLGVDLAVAVASGRQWCGIQPVQTGTVIYCDEEAGQAEIARQFLRHGAQGLSNLHVSSCVGLRLDDPQSILRLELEIDIRRPALVVLDTATQFFAGADENSAPEIAERFQPLLRMRERFECSFVIVHHLRKPSQQGHADLLDMVRGSTAYTTQASAVWCLVRSMGGRSVDLTTEKRRGSGASKSLRVEYTEAGDEIELRSLGAPETMETQLDASSRFIVAHLKTAPGRRAGTAEFVAAGKAEGFGERTIKSALTHLRRVGAIVRVKKGVYELPPNAAENEATDGDDE